MADPVGFGFIRAGAAELTRPVSLGLRHLIRNVGSLDEQISAYIRAGSQNASLRRQVDTNRPLLIEAQAIQQENMRLKKLLQLAETTDDKVATALLISSSSASTRRIARISAGRLQGVEAGMPVRAPEGLIGRVLVAGANTSDVLLISDSQSIIPVRRIKDNVPAICVGLDDGTLEIRAVGTASNPFKPGDILVTSGTGGLYSPNIPVAIVVDQRRGAAIAAPLASPARVESILVQRAFSAPMPSASSAGETAQSNAAQASDNTAVDTPE
jgi:rod shape-determining protein MreC